MLEVENLSREVGGRVLFRGLSFSLNRGESLAIAAPSGYGKTQVLRCLAHLVPHEGTVKLDDQSPQEVGIPQWRRKVVYCPQTPPLFRGSPADFAEQVRMFAVQAEVDWEDPRAIAAEWQVDKVWEKPWTTLSGGEAQRAALALAVATRPEILLLDEPTSALDHASRTLIEDKLYGRTMIWVTHDSEQVGRVASRTIDLTEYGETHG